MIWTATLLSISCYSWYLVFTPDNVLNFPNFWTALGGLAFGGILPTLLSFTLNSKLLALNPTVLRIFLLNLCNFLIYAALIFLGNIFINTSLFANSPSLSGNGKYIAASFWQLMSWCFGTYFVIKKPNRKQTAVQLTLQPPRSACY